LEAVIEMLRVDAPLPPRYRPHKLVGSLAPLWECHIEPDWLLVYFVTSDSVDLYDTGTHSDLFD
jgi:mRNA interferase YafQ